MMKNMMSVLFAAMIALTGFLITGCEDDGGGGGSGGNNAFVGTWLVTKEGTQSYYVFNADGTYRKNRSDEPVDGSVHFYGTYTVAKGALHGVFTNPGVGDGEIEATINDDGTMNLLFIEHWHNPYKRVPCTGVKQTGTPDDDNDKDDGDDDDGDPDGSGNRMGGFLWKPVGNDGNLVVLLPSRLTGHVNRENVIIASHPDGSGRVETGRFAGAEDNGGREHFRFSKPGAAYGDNLYIVADVLGGADESWFVPAGSVRTE